MRTYSRIVCLLVLVSAVPLFLLFHTGGYPPLAAFDRGSDVVQEVQKLEEDMEGDGVASRRDDGPTWNMTADYYGAPAEPCSAEGNGNTVFVYVYTAPRNAEKRKKIRSTWASVKSHNGTTFKVVFFLGKVTSYALQLSLAKEMRQYRDLVQDKSYIDSYRNLTRKGLSALLWVSKNCPHAFRVVKVDDDTLVNPYNLIDLLRSVPPDALEKFVCPVTHSAKPIRKPNSKYFVSTSEFEGEYYPMYCQGYAYTMPPSIIEKLLVTALNYTLFTMEDVFITGLLASYHNITHYALDNFYSTTFRDGSTEDLINKILSRPAMTFLGHTKAMVYYDLFWRVVSRATQPNVVVT